MKKINLLEIGTGTDFKKWNIPEYISTVTPYFNNDEDSIEITCVDPIFGKGKNISYADNNITIRTIGNDIISFLKEYSGPNFDFVFSERCLEHISYNELHYLFYLLYTKCEDDACMEIVVPNFDHISGIVLDMDSKTDKAQEFQRNLIIAHTEVFNDETDPHRSIWNEPLAHYYMETEKYWQILKLEENFEIDNRNCYMSIIATINK